MDCGNSEKMSFHHNLSNDFTFQFLVAFDYYIKQASKVLVAAKAKKIDPTQFRIWDGLQPEQAKGYTD